LTKAFNFALILTEVSKKFYWYLQIY